MKHLLGTLIISILTTTLGAGERQNGGGLIIGRFIAGKDLIIKQVQNTPRINRDRMPKVVPEELAAYGFRTPEDYQEWYSTNRSSLMEKLRDLRFEKNPNASSDCAQTDAHGPVVLLNIDLCSQQVHSVAGAAAIAFGEAVHHTRSGLRGGTRDSWTQAEEDTFAAFYASIAEISWYGKDDQDSNDCISEARFAKEFTNAVENYAAKVVLEKLNSGLRVHEPMLSADCDVGESYYTFITKFFSRDIGSSGIYFGNTDNNTRMLKFLKELNDGGAAELTGEILAAMERQSDQWRRYSRESLNEGAFIDLTIVSSINITEESQARIDTFLRLMKDLLPESFERSRESVFAYTVISNRPLFPEINVETLNTKKVLRAVNVIYSNGVFQGITWTQKIERLAAKNFMVTPDIAQDFLDDYLSTQLKSIFPFRTLEFRSTLVGMIDQGAQLDASQLRKLLFASTTTIKSWTWEFDHHEEHMQTFQRKTFQNWLDYHRFLKNDLHFNLDMAIDEHGRNLFDYVYYYEFLYRRGLEDQKAQRGRRQELLEKLFAARLATTSELMGILRDELQLKPSGICFGVDLPSRAGESVGVTHGIRVGPGWGAFDSLIVSPYIIDKITTESDNRLRDYLLRSVPPAVRVNICPK